MCGQQQEHFPFGQPSLEEEHAKHPLPCKKAQSAVLVPLCCAVSPHIPMTWNTWMSLGKQKNQMICLWLVSLFRLVRGKHCGGNDIKRFCNEAYLLTCCVSACDDMSDCVAFVFWKGRCSQSHFSTFKWMCRKIKNLAWIWSKGEQKGWACFCLKLNEYHKVPQLLSTNCCWYSRLLNAKRRIFQDKLLTSELQWVCLVEMMHVCCIAERRCSWIKNICQHLTDYKWISTYLSLEEVEYSFLLFFFYLRPFIFQLIFTPPHWTACKICTSFFLVCLCCFSKFSGNVNCETR